MIKIKHLTDTSFETIHSAFSDIELVGLTLNGMVI